MGSSVRRVVLELRTIDMAPSRRADVVRSSPLRYLPLTPAVADPPSEEMTATDAGLVGHVNVAAYLALFEL